MIFGGWFVLWFTGLLYDGEAHTTYFPIYSTKSTISSDKDDAFKTRSTSHFSKLYASIMVCICVFNGMLMRPERYAYASQTVCFRFWSFVYIFHFADCFTRLILFFLGCKKGLERITDLKIHNNSSWLCWWSGASTLIGNKKKETINNANPLSEN